MTIYQTEIEAFEAGGKSKKGFRVLRQGNGFKVLIVPTSGLPFYL